jgi:hypothetical protein
MSSRRTTLRTLRAALPGAGALADEGIIRGAAMGVSAAGSPESVRDKKFSSAREKKKVLAHVGKVSSRASQGAAAC